MNNKIDFLAKQGILIHEYFKVVGFMESDVSESTNEFINKAYNILSNPKDHQEIIDKTNEIIKTTILAVQQVEEARQRIMKQAKDS